VFDPAHLVALVERDIERATLSAERTRHRLGIDEAQADAGDQDRGDRHKQQRRAIG
jgi:hypothetical protein